MKVGVCSWSLQPTSPDDLVEKVRATGLARVQLALDPLRTNDWSPRATVVTLEDAGIEIGSGMMGTHGEDYTTMDTIRETGGFRVDAHWERNLKAAADNAALAQELGLDLVTLHAGFLPHEPGELRDKLVDRLRQVLDRFADQGVHVGFETGQEDADTLLAVLAELDHPMAGVNFDPANMILYGMGEPVAALKAVADHVRQIHVKDALPTQTPGEWGTEVTAGTGAVDWDAFFAVVREAGLDVDLMIEREAGDDRVGDIARARELLQQKVG